MLWQPKRIPFAGNWNSFQFFSLDPSPKLRAGPLRVVTFRNFYLNNIFLKEKYNRVGYEAWAKSVTV